MKVAIVLMKYNPFGGYERQAALITKALVERGDSVTVFASEWQQTESESATAVKRDEKGSKKGRLTFHKVPIVRTASWLKVLSFALRSRKEIKECGIKFDAVIAFDRTLVADIYRAGNACHKEWLAYRRRSSGFTDRLSVAVNMLHRVINTIEASIFKGVKEGRTKVVALSKDGIEQITRFYEIGKNREKGFVVIAPAIDIIRLDCKRKERAVVRKELGAKESTLVLLHVGSGFKIKGLSSTIGAAAELVNRGLDSLLIVAGKDKKESVRLKALAKKLGIEDRVKFLGGVSNVAELYGAADIFVVPSNFETFGLAFMEALYFGLPVIAGRGAGAAPVIEGRAVGTVVDVPVLASVLADRIEKCAVAEAEYKKNGTLLSVKRKRKECAFDCSAEKVIEEFLAEVDKAAAKCSQAQGKRDGKQR